MFRLPFWIEYYIEWSDCRFSVLSLFLRLPVWIISRKSIEKENSGVQFHTVMVF